MDKEVKEKWLIALRSGEYKQGMSCLKNKTTRTKYCCLGVLIEVTVPERFTNEGSIQDPITKQYLRGTLSSDLREKFKLEELNTHTLIDMNDHQNKNFKEIADFIEENL